MTDDQMSRILAMNPADLAQALTGPQNRGLYKQERMAPEEWENLYNSQTQKYGRERVCRVDRDGESLVAVLAENTPDDKKRLNIEQWNPEISGRRVSLAYRNRQGDTAKIFIVNGLRRDEDMLSCIGETEAVHRLGPELKKQIPQDWYQVVGSWLDCEQMPAETAKKD
jgi:hypothetical protein